VRSIRNVVCCQVVFLEQLVCALFKMRNFLLTVLATAALSQASGMLHVSKLGFRVY
jgi:hypothetical protein